MEGGREGGRTRSEVRDELNTSHLFEIRIKIEKGKEVGKEERARGSERRERGQLGRRYLQIDLTSFDVFTCTVLVLATVRLTNVLDSDF